ncbi:MAG: pyridoxamine 5'-phosphate oxidase family protein [Ruthenibacterium lactatiformans]
MRSEAHAAYGPRDHRCRKITQIIQTCHCCRLGFCDNGAVYIVPLNFGYAEENGKRVFYFHSAKSGRKLDLIAGTPPSALSWT